MERNDELIDLGAASTETRGLVGREPDWSHGQDMGLAQD